MHWVKISMHVNALQASTTYFRVRRGVFGIFSDYTREVQTLPAVSSAAPRDIQILEYHRWSTFAEMVQADRQWWLNFASLHD